MPKKLPVLGLLPTSVNDSFQDRNLELETDTVARSSDLNVSGVEKDDRKDNEGGPRNGEEMCLDICTGDFTDS